MNGRSPVGDVVMRQRNDESMTLNSRDLFANGENLSNRVSIESVSSVTVEDRSTFLSRVKRLKTRQRS